MFVATFDPARGLLKITAAGEVEPDEARVCLEQLRSLAGELTPGFRLLTDLSGVESMSTAAAPHIGQMMKLCTAHGVESVVRIRPPEPRKDIGYAILSQFHYGRRVRIVTCSDAKEAAHHLAE
jgi:anti-anti-sigma regulatory factor